MSDDSQRETVELLREIHDRQREAVDLLRAQLERSRTAVAESIGLQKTALQRQRQVMLIALPAILACIAAIGYLVLRYF